MKIRKGQNLHPAAKKTEEANVHQNEVIDELLEDVRNLIIEIQQASVSLIQRRFSIGYERASKIMDQLEKDGVVGPFEGSKERKVLTPPKQ